MSFALLTATVVVVMVAAAHFAFTVKEEQTQSRIIEFDEQLALHRNYRTPTLGESLFSMLIRPSNILTKEEFIRQHLDSFGVSKESLVLKREFTSSIGTKVSHYDQLIRGVRVHGARVSIIQGRHGGVVRVSGQMLHQASTSHIKTTPTKMADSKEAVNLIKRKIMSTYHSEGGTPTIKIVENEVVFYREYSIDTKSVSNEAVLAHRVKGSSIIVRDRKNWGIVFDVFIDAHSGQVLNFLSRDPFNEGGGTDRSNTNTKAKAKEINRRFLTFKSSHHKSIASDYYTGNVSTWTDLTSTGTRIQVWDCNMAEYETCDRTLVWDSFGTASSSAWPTSSHDINKAVAVTIQFVRMMRSISGQGWKSYNNEGSVMSITINIDMENAFFDGIEIFIGQV